LDTLLKLLTGAIKTAIAVLAAVGIEAHGAAIHLDSQNPWTLLGLIILIKAACDLLHIRIQIIRNGAADDNG
jgi:hypothetical protein